MLAEQDEEHNPAPSIAEFRVQLSDDQSESVHLQDPRKYDKQDDKYQQLKATIWKGFPDHKNTLPDSSKRYWQIQHSLTIDDDLTVYGCQLLILSQMRRQVLQQLYEAHQGATHTKQ